MDWVISAIVSGLVLAALAAFLAHALSSREQSSDSAAQPKLPRDFPDLFLPG